MRHRYGHGTGAVGSRLQPGFTCPLGEFHPIAIEEVEELKELQEEGRQRDAMKVEPAELPEDEAAEPAEAAPEESDQD